MQAPLLDDRLSSKKMNMTERFTHRPYTNNTNTPINNVDTQNMFITLQSSQSSVGSLPSKYTKPYKKTPRAMVNTES